MGTTDTLTKEPATVRTAAAPTRRRTPTTPDHHGTAAFGITATCAVAPGDEHDRGVEMLCVGESR